MAGARPIVDGPAFTPLPYGLWDAVQKPAPDPHWRQGITYIDRCPDLATTYDECITVTGTGEAPPAPSLKTDNVDQLFRGATPFTVYAEFDCSPVGLADAGRAAVDALDRMESWQVERVFSTGVTDGITGQFPHLAADTEVLDAQGLVLQTAASVLVTGSGVDVADGLGRIEAELAACYGGQGLIHIPTAALPTFAAWNLAEIVGGRLMTPRGNLLVVGNGYANTSPAGAAAPAGSAWIYATGAMFGYRSEAFFTQAVESFDRAENTMKMLAERTYLLAFSCCHLAALVDLGVPVT